MTKTTAHPTQLAPARSGLPQIARWIGVAACLVGWFVSYQLMAITGGVQNTLVGALCGESESGSNCASVLRSSYAMFGGGPDVQEQRSIPWAVMGMAYYALLGSWLLFVGPVSRSRWYWQTLMLLLSGLGLIFSLDLIRIMVWELQQICEGCMIAHACNAIIFLTLLLSLPWRAPKRPQRIAPALPHALATLTAALSLGVLHLALYGTARASQVVNDLTREMDRLMADADYVRWDHARQPFHEIPVRENAIIAGDPTTPHQIVFFSDPQCEACRKGHALMEQLVAERPSSVHVVYRFFPQSTTCNPYLDINLHPSACAATRAILAVNQVANADTCVEYMHTMFKFQKRIPVAGQFLAWGRGLSVDSATLQNEMDSDAVTTRLNEDIEFANALGVASLPAVFLDGRRVRLWRNDAFWNATLSDEDTRPQPRNNAD